MRRFLKIIHFFEALYEKQPMLGLYQRTETVRSAYFSGYSPPNPAGDEQYILSPIHPQLNPMFYSRCRYGQGSLFQG